MHSSEIIKEETIIFNSMMDRQIRDTALASAYTTYQAFVEHALWELQNAHSLFAHIRPSLG